MMCAESARAGGFPKMWDPLKMDQNGWFIVEKWIKKPFKWITNGSKWMVYRCL